MSDSDDSTAFENLASNRDGCEAFGRLVTNELDRVLQLEYEHHNPQARDHLAQARENLQQGQMRYVLALVIDDTEPEALQAALANLSEEQRALAENTATAEHWQHTFVNFLEALAHTELAAVLLHAPRDPAYERSDARKRARRDALEQALRGSGTPQA